MVVWRKRGTYGPESVIQYRDAEGKFTRGDRPNAPPKVKVRPIKKVKTKTKGRRTKTAAKQSPPKIEKETIPKEKKVRKARSSTEKMEKTYSEISEEQALAEAKYLHDQYQEYDYNEDMSAYLEDVRHDEVAKSSWWRRKDKGGQKHAAKAYRESQWNAEKMVIGYRKKGKNNAKNKAGRNGKGKR